MIMRHGRFARTGLLIVSMIALVPASTPLQIAPARAVDRTASAPSALVYFHYPVDGMRVPERFTVKIGLKEMGVAPAGVVKPFTGHHHLLIDTDMVPLDQPIPSDYNHIHLGDGQTEVVLTLPPGNAHLAAAARRPPALPHQPPVMSKKITIYVR